MSGGIGRVTHHPDYYLSDGSVSFLVGPIHPAQGHRSADRDLWPLQDRRHFVQGAQIVF